MTANPDTLGEFSRRWGNIEKYDTLPHLLFANGREYGDEVALREKDLGIWNAITWRDYAERVRRLALVFAELGVAPGDTVALLGNNGPYWLYGALAAHANQGLSLGVYSDVLADECTFLLDFTEAKIIVVEDEEQADKVLSLGERARHIKKIIYKDPRGMRKYDSDRLLALDDALARGAELDNGGDIARQLDERLAAARGDDSALLITTSGTTAQPKFAEISHIAFLRHIREYLKIDPKSDADEYVSALPLPWIMETKYVLGKSLLCRMKINFAENSDTLMADLREIGPTFLLLAPRVWEQIAGTVRARMLESTPLKRRLFDWGMKIGLAKAAEGARSPLADFLVFRALRDTLGLSRLSSAATGGAALGPDTYKFFIAMGVPLKQLYGQTELIGAYTIHRSGDIDMESSGLPFDGVEIKITDADSEGLGKIVTRHPNMMRGYHRAPEETRQAIDRDGYMETGDAGYFKDNGHLVVIDRYADLSRTSSGTGFSPQYLENKLKFSPYLAEAVVLGDARPYLTAILCIRFPIVAKWAEQRRITFTSYTDLSARPEVRALIRQEVETVNRALPPAQQLKKFILLYKELDADDGELTRTKKVRRKVINERYADIIDILYSDERQIKVDSEITLQDGGKQRIRATLEIDAL